MEVLDPGHYYRLETLDGDGERAYLRFVKRNSPPEKYPGNASAYPGTTLQEVLRASIDRVIYVNRQHDAPENYDILRNLRRALVSLEHRAARIHGRDPKKITTDMAMFGPFCPECGHVGHNCIDPTASVVPDTECRYCELMPGGHQYDCPAAQQ